MKLDSQILAGLAVAFLPNGYYRVTPLAHRSTPLGLGCARTRFSSPDDAFKVLYLAEDLATGVAETMIRDRFENRARRRMGVNEVATWGVTRVSALTELNVIDLRTTGLLRLGVSTDAARAKAHRYGPQLSAAIHETTDADGILYGSRLTGAVCCAVYARSVGKLTAGPVEDILTDASLAGVFDRLAIELVLAG